METAFNNGYRLMRAWCREMVGEPPQNPLPPGTEGRRDWTAGYDMAKSEFTRNPHHPLYEVKNV